MASNDGLDVHGCLYMRFCAFPSVVECAAKSQSRASNQPMATIDTTRCRIIPSCHGRCYWCQCIWSYAGKTKRCQQRWHSIPQQRRNNLCSTRGSNTTSRRNEQWRIQCTNKQPDSIWQSGSRRLWSTKQLWSTSTKQLWSINRLWSACGYYRIWRKASTCTTTTTPNIRSKHVGYIILDSTGSICRMEFSTAILGKDRSRKSSSHDSQEGSMI